MSKDIEKIGNLAGTQLNKGKKCNWKKKKRQDSGNERSSD